MNRPSSEVLTSEVELSECVCVCVCGHLLSSIKSRDRHPKKHHSRNVFRGPLGVLQPVRVSMRANDFQSTPEKSCSSVRWCFPEPLWHWQQTEGKSWYENLIAFDYAIILPEFIWEAEERRQTGLPSTGIPQMPVTVRARRSQSGSQDRFSDFPHR